ncbi:MAG: methyltransferase domain-containing protein [bacterium]|nr:methyltransferase domain-containing protein [bacterium]
MVSSHRSPEENILLSETDRAKLEEAYNRLIKEMPIVDGQRVLSLCRGTWDSIRHIIERNRNGHLYVVLGPDVLVAGKRESKRLAGLRQDGNLTFLCCPMTKLPLPDAFFDRVVAVYSPVLFQCKQAIVKEVCRVLKPGGIFSVLYFEVKELANAHCFEIRKDYYLSCPREK